MTVALRKEGWSIHQTRTRTDFSVATTGSPTPEGITEVLTLSFEVEEAGRYEINARATIQTGTGTAFNEANLILIVDGSFYPQRINMAVLNSAVASRHTHNWTRSVVLSEGTHVVRIGAWAFNANATLIAGSGGDDAASISVRRRS